MRTMMSVVAVVSTLAGCTDPSPAAGPLSVGTWGGDNAGVVVTETTTHVHIGCTVGDIPVRVAAGPDGQFSIEGEYVLRAYPIMVGPRLPAVFSGRVVGRSLTMVVVVNDTTEGKVVTLGPVSVVLGRNPEMGPCPICRVTEPGGTMASAGPSRGHGVGSKP